MFAFDTVLYDAIFSPTAQRRASARSGSRQFSVATDRLGASAGLPARSAVESGDEEHAAVERRAGAPPLAAQRLLRGRLAGKTSHLARQLTRFCQ